MNLHRRQAAAGSYRMLLPMTRVLAVILSVMVAIGTVPAKAQQFGNPFGGRPSGGVGPYGSDAGATVHLMQNPQAMGLRYGATNAAGPAAALVEGSDRPEAPHRPEADSYLWEALFAGCAAGSFLGGFTALTTTTVATAGAAAGAPVGLALPLLSGAIASASAIGCALGASTAAISLGASTLWREMVR